MAGSGRRSTTRPHRGRRGHLRLVPCQGVKLSQARPAATHRHGYSQTPPHHHDRYPDQLNTSASWLGKVGIAKVDDLGSVARLVATRSPGWSHGSFLTELSSACLSELISAARIVTFMLDDVLIEEGTADDGVFLLLSSYVKVTARVDRGAEALLAVRSAGDVVGELAALDRRPRSATVRACGKQSVVAARLPGETFWNLVCENKKAARLLTSIVSSKLRTATRRRVDYAGASPRVRVARAIHELLLLHGRPVGSGIVIGLDLTQVELGSLVGVTRPTAERALRELRVAGLVDTGGRRLIVLNEQGLRAVADEGIGPSDDGELSH